MTTTLTALPASFSAGSTVAYRRVLSDYPAGVWALSLHLGGPSHKSFTAAADGTAFVVTLSATDTAALTPGRYEWVERVSKGSEVYDVGAGLVSVTLNLATASDGDAQTPEEKRLAIVEAELARRLATGLASYQLPGVAITKIPTPELEESCRKLKLTVAFQRGTLIIGRQVLTRFSPEGRGQ